MNDKQKHMAIAAAFGLLALPLSYKVGLANSYVVITLISSLLFYLKEITDRYDIDLWFYKHKATGFDKMDLVADYAGLLSGFIVSFIIHTIIQIIKL